MCDTLCTIYINSETINVWVERVFNSTNSSHQKISNCTRFGPTTRSYTNSESWFNECCLVKQLMLCSSLHSLSDFSLASFYSIVFSRGRRIIFFFLWYFWAFFRCLESRKFLSKPKFLNIFEAISSLGSLLRIDRTPFHIIFHETFDTDID